MKKPKLKRKRKQEQPKQIMGPALTEQNITDLLSGQRGPKVLWRDKQVLESEELSNDKQELVIDGKKLVMETTVIQSTTKYVKLREYGTAGDTLQEFMKKG